jgi:hypothetical protein
VSTNLTGHLLSNHILPINNDERGVSEYKSNKLDGFKVRTYCW